MCISAKVGDGGKNNSSDVKIVQVLLNLAIDLGNFPRLAVDGLIGAKDSATVNRIRAFQEKVVRLRVPDGRVDPLPGRTLRKLKERMSPAFTEMKLRGIMAQGRENDIAKYYLPLMVTMQARSISTPLRMAHFLAQLGHESGDLRYVREIGTGEAYEGREDLGNTKPGDGKRFKGRGLIQLTGRKNYEDYGDSRGIKLVDGDKVDRVASDPTLAVDVAGWYWAKHDLNKLADADDVRAITFAINGGYNGLEDRKKRLVRAKFFLVK